jgi:hypothetical protein
VTARADLWLRILAAVDACDGESTSPAAFCVACVAELGVVGAGIALMDPSTAAGSYASDPITQMLGELQFTLGVGPTADAFASGAPVIESDLAGRGRERWAQFAPLATAAGMGSVSAFPLMIGAARVGTLTLYWADSGALGYEASTEALFVAEMITRSILGWQASAREGMLASELYREGSYQSVVHQASGMISVQLAISVGEALALLRARSFASSRNVTDLAADVVARRIRFDQ